MAKTVKKTTTKVKKSKEKKETSALEAVPRAALAFYADTIDKIEAKTKMYSNSLRYLDPLSTGVLVLDRALGGGLYNTFSSVAGAEGSGKTTICYHLMANSIHNQFVKFTGLEDAEGTLNPNYAANVFKPFGLNFKQLMHDKPSPFRYYRKNVIETMIDLLHATLKNMPDKVWVEQTGTWGYVIPKRDKHFENLKNALGLKIDKSLTTDGHYIAPTEYAGLEGSFFVDSLAAMVTEEDDDNEEKTKRRAVEASSFSAHMKRIVSRLSSKGVGLFGVNQLRKTPGVTYGDPHYEPGGDALKFYSASRLRTDSRVPKEEAGERDTKTGHLVEKSVDIPGAKDRYAYKFFKNTKNKITFPGHSGFFRVWISDGNGKVRGIDPFYDVFQYLLETGQMKKHSRAKGKGFLYIFKVKDSVGKKRAGILNSIEPFTYFALKSLIIGEVDKNVKLLKLANKEMGLKEGLKLDLRDSLFNQLRNDPSVLRIENTQKDEVGDEDDDDVDEL